MPQEHELFDLGRVELQSGGVLPAARLAYKTYGRLNEARDNAVLLPTFYTGTHLRNEGYFGPGRAIVQWAPGTDRGETYRLRRQSISRTPGCGVRSCSPFRLDVRPIQGKAPQRDGPTSPRRF